MRKLTSAEIKQIEFNLLVAFDAYCRNQGLTYYLCGGTLLGAIRHKGFIPWDDDIDICMPRPDYEKLLVGGHSFFHTRKMAVQNGSAADTYPQYAFARLMDLRTSVNTKFTDRLPHLWIDILPVDGLPEDLETVGKIFGKAERYRRILRLTGANLGEGKTVFRKYAKYILKPLARLYGAKRCVDNINALAVPYRYEDCRYVGIVTNGLYGIGERMLKAEFEKAVPVEFEGKTFPTFSCWDSYLQGIYGDYMKVPPAEKRTTHDIEAYMVD